VNRAYNVHAADWDREREALRGLKECRLNAQSHALDIYRQHGFEAYDAEFMEAGIPHQNMKRNL
jgi:predicted GNAT family N-acyltransferase